MISNSLMETIHRGLIDFRERSSTQPLGFFPLGFPAPGSKGCWVGGKTHHTHKHLILRVGKAAKFVHIRRPKTLTFCKKALSLTWWMRCLRAMNVARKCYTKWRVGSQRQKRQPEGFCSHFGEEAWKGGSSENRQKGAFWKHFQGDRGNVQVSECSFRVWDQNLPPFWNGFLKWFVSDSDPAPFTFSGWKRFCAF